LKKKDGVYVHEHELCDEYNEESGDFSHPQHRRKGEKVKGTDNPGKWSEVKRGVLTDGRRGIGIGDSRSISVSQGRGSHKGGSTSRSGSPIRERVRRADSTNKVEDMVSPLDGFLQNLDLSDDTHTEASEKEAGAKPNPNHNPKHDWRQGKKRRRRLRLGKKRIWLGGNRNPRRNPNCNPNLNPNPNPNPNPEP